MPNETPAVVLLSGGQDSATCLYWARERFAPLYALGFDYGQRHRVELTQARVLAERAGVKYDVLNLQALLPAFAPNALTDPTLEVQNATDGGLPNTFLPGRNLLFLTLAAQYGYARGAFDIVGGMCEADFSGYPDCRQDFVDAAAVAVSRAFDKTARIHTPLMRLDKAETWRLADALGCLTEIVEHSHTCYEGDRTRRHDWGYGCGLCPACVLRKRGFRAAFAG